MSAKDVGLNKIELDANGRIVLGDDLLESIAGCEGEIVAGANLSCTGSTNSSCSNGVCPSTTNGACTNVTACTGAVNTITCGKSPLDVPTE